MARQEDDAMAGEAAEAKRVRGLAEGRCDLAPFDVGEPVDLVETAAADDADYRGGHGEALTRWLPISSSISDCRADPASVDETGKCQRADARGPSHDPREVRSGAT